MKKKKRQQLKSILSFAMAVAISLTMITSIPYVFATEDDPETIEVLTEEENVITEEQEEIVIVDTEESLEEEDEIIEILEFQETDSEAIVEEINELTEEIMEVETDDSELPVEDEQVIDLVEQPIEEIEETGTMMVQNFGIQSIESVKVTAITNSNPSTNPYVTNQSNKNKLTVKGTYSFVDSTQQGELTETISFTLKNTTGDRGYYFTSADSITWPIGSENQDVAVDLLTGDITVKCDVRGGYGTSGSITINYVFNHEAYDGKVANGKKIANIIGTTSSQSTPFNYDIISSTSDRNNIYSFAKLPAYNTPLDFMNTVTFAFENHASNLSSSYWHYEPGTDMKIVLEYPIGAIISNSLTFSKETPNATPVTGVNYPEEGKIIWTIGTANNDGIIENGWSAIYDSVERYQAAISGIGLTFPSETFEEGDELSLSLYAQYTLYGADSETTYNATTKNFTIETGKIHLAGDGLTLSGEGMSVNIEDPTFRSIESFLNNIKNNGSTAAPEVCATWFNDTGTKKANINTVRINKSGDVAKFKVVYYFAKNGTTSRDPEIRYLSTATTYALNHSAVNITLDESEYIEKIEFWPLSNTQSLSQINLTNEQLELPMASSFNVCLTYSSWYNKEFPNGTQINHGDISKIRYSVSWKGESQPELFASMGIYPTTGDVNTKFTIDIVDKKEQILYYGAKISPNPIAYYTLADNQGGSLRPGDTVSANLTFYNANTYSASDWDEPSFIIIPPVGLIVDTNQNLQCFKGTDKTTVLGDTEIEQIVVAGKIAYIITVKNLVVPRTGASSSANHVIPIDFKVKIGAPVGTYDLANFTKANSVISTANAGKLIPVGPAGYQLIYPSDILSSTAYYADLSDYDNNDKTSYLRVILSGTSAKVSVASSQSMKVNAELYNNTANEGTGAWQEVSNPEAQATVKLDGTGKFKLEILNQGNTYLGNIELLNILPNSIDGQGSVWYPTLNNIQVDIYDNNDALVEPGKYGYTIAYSNVGNPTYSNTILNYTGTSAWSANATMATAKSFLFKLNTAASNRLPGGYKIVITGTLKAPESAGVELLEQPAYNMFYANAAYYDNNTNDNGKFVPTQLSPTRQEFILIESGTAKLTKSGYVFKDIDGDGLFGTGDVIYEGATVTLHYADPSDPTKPLETALDTTETDENGKYLFEELYGGTYFVKVTLPSSSTYSYSPKGTGTTASHVNSTGYSDAIILNAGELKPVDTNVGIIANAKLTVEFREGSITGTKLKTVVVDIDSELSSLVVPFKSGTITPTVTSDISLPTGYSIKTGTDLSKGYTLSWENPQETLIFVVELNKYEITYLKNDGTTDEYTNLKQSEVSHGTKATKPSNPSRPGYNFGGWYTDATTQDVTTLYDFNDVVTGAVTLYACWNTYSYTVTYDVVEVGASGATTKEVASPKTTVETLPIPPTKAGLTFEGWYKEPEYTNAFTASTEVIRSMTVYAKWSIDQYTIDFDVNDGDSIAPSNQTKVYNELVDTVAAPTRAGYNFAGWYTSEVTVNPQGTAFNFETDKVTGDMTLHAGWNEYSYTVTFDGNETDVEDIPEVITVNSPDTTIGTLPTPPTKIGSTFNGWYKNAECTGDQFTGSVVVEEDLIVYAKWIEVYYLLDFNLNGGTSATPTAQSLAYKAKANSVGDPIYEHHKFIGWNTKQDGSGTAWDFSINTMPANKLTLFAQWADIEYELSFNLNGATGDTPATQLIVFNNLANNVTEPQNNGYIFEGWNTKQDGTGDAWNFAFSKMPARSVVLYAQWKVVVVNDSPSTPTPTTTTEPIQPASVVVTVTTPQPTASSMPIVTTPAATITPTPSPTATPVTIIDEEAPLAGPEGLWSVFNLIASIATAIAAVFVIGRNKKYAGKWQISSAVLSVAAILLFIFTEDVSNTMVLFDKYSWIAGGLALVQIIILFIGKNNKEESQKNNI